MTNDERKAEERKSLHWQELTKPSAGFDTAFDFRAQFNLGDGCRRVMPKYGDNQ